MGAVYRAFDDVLQRPVAIKQLLPHLADKAQVLRFRREARMAARLNHPAIVHIYEIVEDADGDWIVMELVKGKTLDRLLREERLELTRAVRIVREIAEGLSEAHAQGVVHRDLKATNVMVTGAGRVKILDFGLAKIYRGDVEHDISRPGTVVGTCHAMSPEQAQGLAVDHRSDLFSLGSLLYEVLTGISPFHAATPTETLARICAWEPQPVVELERGVPPELADLTHRLLAKTVGGRPQSAWEVATQLERIERAGLLERDRRISAAAMATQVETVALEPAAPPPPRSSTRTPLTNIERRQVTVLCCELADTARPGAEAAQVFDPETLYELMLQLRPLTQMVATRYQGSLGNVLGHRLLVYFGYPDTHEDDAWRAVRAGLELVSEAAAQLRAGSGLARVSPALRVGIHTGTAVVAGHAGGPEPVVLGNTLDVALRLLTSAAPGTVVMSGATRSLVHRAVSSEALPALDGSGVGEPLVPYLVRDRADSGEESPFDASPLIGRERELDLVLTRWSEARRGRGQAVLLSGEPGIGKSRLLRAVRQGVTESLGTGEVQWLFTHGSPYTQNTPLHPVVLFVQRLLGTQPGGSPQEQLERLLAAHDLAEALPLLGSLLDLPLPNRHRVPPMPPERQREETLDALMALIVEMAARQPVVLCVEDLHWLDATSLAWLDRLIDQASSAALLLLMTIRPNTLDVPWASRAQVTQVTLGALSADETARLITSLTSDRALESAVREQIVARTDGVPLFVEELTRSVLESGGAEEWRELPATLRESLTARLARLGTAKEVAQLASVIGRSFSLALLSSISPQAIDDLERDLRRLVQSGLVNRRGFGALTRYAFKHALVRDAAYDSLLRRERQQIHLRIALALEEQRRLDADEVPSEIVAHHYMLGEQFAAASDAWFHAAHLATARYAHVEAVAHLRHAIEALLAQPRTPERDRREVALQNALAMSLGIIRGLSSPEVEATQERLLALVGQVADVPHEIFFGLWNFYASKGRLQQARDLARQRLTQATAHHDRDARLLAIYTSAASDLFLGHLEAARQGFEELLAVYPSDGLATQAIAYDIGVVARSLLGDVLWLLGRPDAALEASDHAVEQGSAFSPFTQSVTVVNRMMLATSMRDDAEAGRQAERLIALSGEYSLQYWTVFWRLSLAIGRTSSAATDAEIDAALAEAVDAIATMRTAYGSQLQCTRYLGWTVTAALASGRLSLARQLLEDALALTAEERYYIADLRRLQARLRRSEGGDAAEVDALLRDALALARAQNAHILALRTAVDLVRLRQEDGDAGAALDELVAACAAVEGGEATPDVRAARALLAELRP